MGKQRAASSHLLLWVPAFALRVGPDEDSLHHLCSRPTAAPGPSEQVCVVLAELGAELMGLPGRPDQGVDRGTGKPSRA